MSDQLVRLISSNLQKVVYFGVDQRYNDERHHILDYHAEQSVAELEP